MNYSLVSNSCVGIELYKLYYSEKNQYFIDYNNPFIGSIFLNDEDYVIFCENYDYYTSLEPVFDEPKNEIWEKETGNKKYIHPACSQDYLIMYLDDIEIHWIHEINKELLLKKYKGRLEDSKNYEKLFLWCESEMFNNHLKSKRDNLVSRFNKINEKTVFLTKYPEEIYVDENHVINFVTEWKDRTDKGVIRSWSTQKSIAENFKKIINEYL